MKSALNKATAAFLIALAVALILTVSCSKKEVQEGTTAAQSEDSAEVEIAEDLDDLDELDQLTEELEEDISFDELEGLEFE